MNKVSYFVILTLWATAFNQSQANNANERMFMWNEANFIMTSARSEAEYMNAAKTYESLISNGTVNRHVLYNFGTALLQAKQYDDALHALERAERYSGRNPEIVRNMLLASAGMENSEHADLAWYRTPLFWHFGLPASTRLNIAVISFSLFCLSLIGRDAGLKRFFKPILIISVGILVIFGSSILITIELESKDQESINISKLRELQKQQLVNEHE